MKSITEMFKRDYNNKAEPDPFEPRYHREDLMPPELLEGEYETLQEQQFRFDNLHPMTVLYEVAKELGGKLTRLKPDDERSTPIVLKSTSMGMCTIVFYKRSLQFTIYETKTFETYCETKKVITNRKSIYGLQKAFEMIETGEYDKIFSDN